METDQTDLSLERITQKALRAHKVNRKRFDTSGTRHPNVVAYRRQKSSLGDLGNHHESNTGTNVYLQSLGFTPSDVTHIELAYTNRLTGGEQHQDLVKKAISVFKEYGSRLKTSGEKRAFLVALMEVLDMVYQGEANGLRSMLQSGQDVDEKAKELYTTRQKIRGISITDRKTPRAKRYDLAIDLLERHVLKINTSQYPARFSIEIP